MVSKITIGGICVGTFGLTRADLVGRTYNLRTAWDIAGTYTAVGAGVAIAGGAKTARLQNSNGVVMALRGRRVGIEFSIDLSGMTEVTTLFASCLQTAGTPKYRVGLRRIPSTSAAPLSHARRLYQFMAHCPRMS
jgi:hypothetical protein